MERKWTEVMQKQMEDEDRQRELADQQRMRKHRGCSRTKGHHSVHSRSPVKEEFWEGEDCIPSLPGMGSLQNTQCAKRATREDLLAQLRSREAAQAEDRIKKRNEMLEERAKASRLLDEAKEEKIRQRLEEKAKQASRRLSLERQIMQQQEQARRKELSCIKIGGRW
eukprot:NODE_2323_length_1230_cov_42.734124_g2118_i0.p2 GENE.NODE_2323_length_1230_cov_42.734124_g2118_i0~~NODE_2323_length_1230_cov_42.734124_g2118_i0.p2  ORF type:complete len:167 (-),score=44.66 NODE_2323_length_1230_cov_42.734124_g2118_i0:103-603(-)